MPTVPQTYVTHHAKLPEHCLPLLLQSNWVWKKKKRQWCSGHILNFPLFVTPLPTLVRCVLSDTGTYGQHLATFQVQFLPAAWGRTWDAADRFNEGESMNIDKEGVCGGQEYMDATCHPSENWSIKGMPAKAATAVVTAQTPSILATSK